MAKTSKDKISEVELSLIDEPKDIVRMEIGQAEVDELASSISEIGLLQPVLLRKDADRFEMVAGHRRLLAHQKLGLATIRAVIRIMTDQEAAIARATENLTRVDLTPIEEASIFFNLINQQGMTLEKIGKQVGKSPGLVKRRMELLRMPENLQKAVHSKQISISVAEELWPITDKATLDYYLSFALDGGCTATVARSWCKDWKDSLRRQTSDDGEGVQVLSPYEPKPTYMACDLCEGAVELGKDKILRLCPACWDIIKKNM